MNKAVDSMSHEVKDSVKRTSLDFFPLEPLNPRILESLVSGYRHQFHNFIDDLLRRDALSIGFIAENNAMPQAIVYN